MTNTMVYMESPQHTIMVKQIKVTFTQAQLEELSFLLWNQLTVLSEEEQDEDNKRTQTVLKQIGTKISKAEAKI